MTICPSNPGALTKYGLYQMLFNYNKGDKPEQIEKEYLTPFHKKVIKLALDTIDEAKTLKYISKGLGNNMTYAQMEEDLTQTNFKTPSSIFKFFYPV